MKSILFLILAFSTGAARAQKIDSIYVNLYTDSLKKGTYNYINIDGKLSNGSYLPLDSTQIIFTSNYGKFYGNSLYIEPKFAKEKVVIKATLRSNPSVCRQFEIFIKKNEDPKILKTEEEIINDIKVNKKKKQS
ncbi:MAG: hypothetical protein ABIP35_00365 [Ginsengibacter sp.]